MGKGKHPQIAGIGKTPEAAMDVDGTSVHDFLEKSIEGSGMSRDAWFKHFNKASGANVHDDASLQSWLDNQYASGGDKAYNRSIYPQMKQISSSAGLPKGTHFFYDTAWQYKSSADFAEKQTQFTPVTQKYTEKQKQKHLSDGSWVDQGGTLMQKSTKTIHHYVDPQKVPFIARHDAPLGTIYKVYNPANPSQAYYAMVMDHSPGTKDVNDSTVTEVSPATLNGLNMKGTPYGVDGHLKAESLGPTTLPVGKNGLPLKCPTAEEIQEQGRLLDKNPIPAPPPPAEKSGAAQITKGEPTVALGKKALPAAFADASCVHTGGGHVVSGSETVFVGKEKRPFARVTDPTSDGYQIKTGEDTVVVG